VAVLVPRRSQSSPPDVALIKMDDLYSTGHRNAAGYFTPTTLGPQAVKKLVEKRNTRFIIAINE
jgi:hypothetical protein